MIYLENICQAAITVVGEAINPKAIGAVDAPADNHAVKSAIAQGLLRQVDEKEFLAYSDPEALAAREAEEAKKGKGK